MLPGASPSAVAAPPGADVTGRRRPGRRRWLIALAALVVLAAGLAWWRYADRGPAPITAADVDRAVKQGIEQSVQEQQAAPPAAALAYQAIGPSLVTVTTDRAAADAAPGEEGRSGIGAGVVINAEGAVLTALHVVEGARQIRVNFADGTQASARVTGSEADMDIAVLAVDRLPEVVVPAVMGSPPPVGGDVFAVGHPLRLQASLTAGVVSATDRSIRTRGGGTLDGLIQFDAAVNPGSSGGPLLNGGGQVVGIVTALANPSDADYFIGVGFAVPIAAAGGVAGGPEQ